MKLTTEEMLDLKKELEIQDFEIKSGLKVGIYLDEDSIEAVLISEETNDIANLDNEGLVELKRLYDESQDGNVDYRDSVDKDFVFKLTKEEIDTIISYVV